MNKFLSKVNKTETCWLWTGATRKVGYGVLKRNGKCLSAHRYSYELFKGKIPEGLDVCHTCDIRLCVNPDHLWVGTRKENMMDASKKGRVTSKNKKYNSKKERVNAGWARYYKKHGKELNERRKIKRSLLKV